jgi:TatD DNase family protein
VTLTDTHCHLDLDKFDADREEVIHRAQENGLVRILIPGLTLSSSRAVVKLAQSHPILFAAVGVHPNEALTWEDNASLAELRELAASPKVVALGEMGLDYYWNDAPHEYQQEVLRAQLSLAGDLGIPVILHSREKDDAISGSCGEDLFDILEEWLRGLNSAGSALSRQPGVLHSFSGSLEKALRAVQLGFYIGVTGPITYKNAGQKREVIANLPLERLLIETDAPFLAPQPQRGERNEPAYIAYIADKIAQIQNRGAQEVALTTSANAARLFSWGEID